MPDEITVGLIPARDAAGMIEQFTPMKEYIEDELGITIQLEVTDDYAELIRKMDDRKVDIAWFGPFSYIAAEMELDLEPLVVQSRKDTGVYYHSLILTKADTPHQSIESLNRTSFAFVEKGSTSGYVIPHAMFTSRDIEYEDYFSEIVYSQSHDGVLTDIINETVTAGAVGDITYNKWLSDGLIDEEELLILWKSSEIPGSPFVAHAQLNEKVKQRFTEAMLEVHVKAPEALIHYNKAIEYYVEADKQMYNSIRNISTILGDEYVENQFLRAQ